MKKRFPTYTHFIESGLLTEEETKILSESTVEKPPYVVPIVWAIALCHQVSPLHVLRDSPGYPSKELDD